jgi:hypothetical protein
VIKENVEVVVPDLEAREHVGAPRSSVRASVPPRRYASHVALVSSIHETSNCIEEERCDDEIDFIHEPSSCSVEERCDALMEDDVETDSRVAVDGSIIEYRARDHGFSQTEGVSHDDTLARDHGFSQTEGVDHDVTLTSRFSQDEGVDLVQVGPVARGFEVHERDSHVHR